MAEKAERVVEAPIAPNTPEKAAQAVAEHSAAPMASGRAERMSYKVGELPHPVNAHDQYVRAQLIEARALRAAVERLASAVERWLEDQASPEEDRASAEKTSAKK